MRARPSLLHQAVAGGCSSLTSLAGSGNGDLRKWRSQEIRTGISLRQKQLYLQVGITRHCKVLQGQGFAGTLISTDDSHSGEVAR